MKQITIYDLFPLFDEKWKWAFFDSKGMWWVSVKKPEVGLRDWVFNWETLDDVLFGNCCLFYKNPFKRIKPFDGDWKDSLIKVEHKEEE